MVPLTMTSPVTRTVMPVLISPLTRSVPSKVMLPECMSTAATSTTGLTDAPCASKAGEPEIVATSTSGSAGSGATPVRPSANGGSAAGTAGTTLPKTSTPSLPWRAGMRRISGVPGFTSNSVPRSRRSMRPLSSSATSGLGGASRLSKRAGVPGNGARPVTISSPSQ